MGAARSAPPPLAPEGGGAPIRGGPGARGPRWSRARRGPEARLGILARLSRGLARSGLLASPILALAPPLSFLLPPFCAAAGKSGGRKQQRKRNGRRRRKKRREICCFCLGEGERGGIGIKGRWAGEGCRQSKAMPRTGGEGTSLALLWSRDPPGTAGRRTAARQTDGAAAARRRPPRHRSVQGAAGRAPGRENRAQGRGNSEPGLWTYFQCTIFVKILRTNGLSFGCIYQIPLVLSPSPSFSLPSLSLKFLLPLSPSGSGGEGGKGGSRAGPTGGGEVHDMRMCGVCMELRRERESGSGHVFCTLPPPSELLH